MKIKSAVMLFAPLLGGCAFVTPHPTSMTLTPQAMEIVGPVKGESTNVRLLCVVPVSGRNASLVSATENALKAASAEAIVNPVVDDERGFGLLGLWCWQKIRVYGTGVRFKRNMAGSAPAAPAAVPPAAKGAQPAARQQKPEAPIDTGDGESITDMEKRLFSK